MDKQANITYTRFDNETNEIIEMSAIKVVKAFANTAHITLPKQLVGKRVRVTYHIQKLNKEKP